MLHHRHQRHHHHHHLPSDQYVVVHFALDYCLPSLDEELALYLILEHVLFEIKL